MADIINRIVLSSGTVIRIPVFTAQEAVTLPAPYETRTKAACVVVDYKASATVPAMIYQLSKKDLIELGNIILGKSCTDIDYNLPSGSDNAGHYIAMLTWIYNPDFSAGNEYTLCHNFRRSGDSISFSYTKFGTNSDSAYFYNSINYTLNNFYDTVANASENLTVPYFNLRSGSLYSLDIASKNNFLLQTLSSYTITPATLVTRYAQYLEGHPDSEAEIYGYDPDDNDDPYVVDDPSTFGGGGGAHGDPDDIEKAEVPELPTLSAVNAGMITMYLATESQLNALASYLWSDIFDVETNFKKIFSDPMDCIIGLGIVPVTPSTSGGANVKFGNINTNVSMSKIASQYVEVSCGSVSIKEFIGSFLDYSPYVNISIYLPYIGYRELSPDDVMNDTISVVYHVDVLTGGCCAMVVTAKKGLLYSFNGSCITNVPITAMNFSGAIQNAVSAVGAGLTTVAGIATGAAPVTAMGVASLASSAANTAMNSKPTIQRSGSMGGSAGLMSYQKPMLVITRPRKSVPDKLNKFVGNTTNVTMNLGRVTGFTMVEHIHLDGIPCTDNERRELETLLKQGVIF